MNTRKVIRDQKRMILTILALIVLIVVAAGGIHIHSQSVKKKEAEEKVETAVQNLQKGNVTKADQILGKKAAEALQTEAMSTDAYMHTIVKALGYTAGDETKDGNASWNDLLTAGNADDSVIRNMKKLEQALQKNCITSYEITGTEMKNDTVTVTVDVQGIILLPKVSFTDDVQNANQKLADNVNKNMDDLMKTYNQAGDNGDSMIQSALKKQELDELIPAMTERVKKAEKTEETWTFTADVSSNQVKIQNVSVSE